MVLDYFSEGDLFSQLDAYREAVQEALDAVERLLDLIDNEVPQEITEEDAQSFIDDYTYEIKRQAADELFRRAIQIMYPIITRACMQTKEYNYGPYVAHLLQAIQAQFYNLIKVDTYFNEVRMYWDCLGDTNEWLDICAQAREALGGLGKSRGWQKEEQDEPRWKDEPETGDVAEIIWEWKIYGVDREGRSVFKWRKAKKTKTKRGKSRKRSGWEDVTQRYRGKYISTIQQRLQLTPYDKAPYIQIINDGTSDYGGRKPYPTFPGTGLFEECRYELSWTYNNIYEHYLDEVRQKIRNRIKEADFFDGGVPAGNPLDLPNIWTEDPREITEILQAWLDNLLTSNVDPIKIKELVDKTIYDIYHDRQILQWYFKKDRIFVRARNEAGDRWVTPSY